MDIVLSPSIIMQLLEQRDHR